MKHYLIIQYNLKSDIWNQKHTVSEKSKPVAHTFISVWLRVSVSQCRLGKYISTEEKVVLKQKSDVFINVPPNEESELGR